MTPGLQRGEAGVQVVECHPELSFWALNDQQPLTEPKKLKSSGHQAGLALRRSLLERVGYEPAFLADRAGLRVKDAGLDDLLDACACAWSASRIAVGSGYCFPADPPLDATGLRMEIRG